MTDAAILAKGLKKSFKGTEVLKGVDFEVRRGEIFALLGSNGAGKTTTVGILSTLLCHDGGTASICGFDVMEQPEKVRQSISLTGQFAAVDGILTGRENLILIARLRDVPRPEQTADELLDRFGLRDAANKRVDTYSGGMTRRLDIAMSLVGASPVIFLDEPTTGLDPEGRLEVWKTVKELAASGTTILLTTQYLEEAEQLADRVAILSAAVMFINVPLQTFIQGQTPPEYMSRVFSIVGLITKGGLPFGALLYGAVLDRIEMQWVTLISCGLIAVLSVLFLAGERRREIE